MMANDKTEHCIGIDLGTTYTCVATVRKNGQVEVLSNEHGNRTTPSYVAFCEHQTLIGKPAKDQAASNPRNTIFDVKRLIGRKFAEPVVQKDMKHWPFKLIEDNGNPNIVLEIPNEKKTFMPEEVSAKVLEYVKDLASKHWQQKVTKAVITVPAYFSDAQRDATRNAGQIAGLDVLRIVNEPTAAGIAYGSRYKTDDKKNNVLVFDLGGGTFDVSILTINRGVYEVVATAGDSHLGGEDFDNNVVDHFIKMLKNKHNIDITENDKAKIRLRAKCEEGKRNLSNSQETTIVVDNLVPKIDFKEKLSRNTFERLNRSLFEKLKQPIQSALNDANLKKEQIDNVVLIGGSSRIKAVQDLINNMFPNKVRQDINNDEAVAYGAAVVAAYLNEEKHDIIKEFHLKDVTALSLGLELNGGKMDVFIRRNMPLPQTETKWFTTNRDTQSSICFVVYEGERPIARDNNRLGEFVISGMDLERKDSLRIKVTLNINYNGILEVKATETLTGSTRDLKLENVGRVSEVDVRRMVQDAIKFRDDDIREARRIDARLALEDYCNSLIFRLKNVNDDENISHICRKALKWMEENEDEETEEIELKLQNLKATCGPIIEKIFQHL